MKVLSTAGLTKLIELIKSSFISVDDTEETTEITLDGVIETYSNGTNWYRIYSDGWCEQGGQTTTNGNITLLKPYSNTDFAVFVADGQNIGSTSCTNAYIVDNSTINIHISWCASAIWEAKGYISQGA